MRTSLTCYCVHVEYLSICVLKSKGALRTIGTFAFHCETTVPMKWSEGVFPQQQRQGWVQRDYRESFMTDLITTSWLPFEIHTPKEHKRCGSYQNLFIIHSLQIMSKYQDCERRPLYTERSLWLLCTQPDLSTVVPQIGTNLFSLESYNEKSKRRCRVRKVGYNTSAA